ncbi:MAG: AMP-binding protein, partial [Kineosporiaceae bacterium]
MAGLIEPLVPTTGRDVAWLVRHWATTAPGRPFLTWAPFDGQAVTWTRAGFAHDVAALATAFRARGLRPGDPVALVLRNHPDFLLAWTAAASMGAVAVCLDPGAVVDELRYAGGHSGARAAVVS